MDILDIISNVGFPIAVSLLSFYYINKTNENYRSDIKELTDKHNEESERFTDALNRNTNAIERLSEKLGGVDSAKEEYF